MSRHETSRIGDLKTVVTNLDDPAWLTRKARNRVAAYVSQRRHRQTGIDYIEADWDNLIVLDACRADLFEEVVDTDRFDDYRRVHSNASLTAEWVQKNLADRRLDDTICVSANPHTSIQAGESFHELIEVWTEAFDFDDYTVPPTPVTNAALDAYQPDKRLIIHYLQPHQPYYTSELWSDLKAEIGASNPHSTNPLRDLQPRPWRWLADGRYSRAEFWSAYRDTLETVYPHVQTLLHELEGRTVVTADHGELFGESVHPLLPWRFYGHPTPGLRLPALTQVPWAVLGGDRRDITPGEITPATSRQDTESAAVRDRLAHLGYT